MVAELVSILFRPLTLTCRLCANLFIGRIVLHFVKLASFGFFYPFWYSTVSDDYRVLVLLFILKLVCNFLMFGFLISEVFIRFVQTFIFVGLLVFYVYEAPLVLSYTEKDKARYTPNRRPRYRSKLVKH